MPIPRVCIVAPEFIGPFPNGGVGTACYWEACTLGRTGHDVTVLYTGPTERETPEHWEAHFPGHAPFRYVDLARHAPAGNPDWSRFDFPCSEAHTAELVLAWLGGQHFDLVLFQEFLGHGARALQARRSGNVLNGARAATTLHSCRQWIYEGMRRLPARPSDVAVDFLEKESARLADRIVAPSRHMADWAAARWRLESRAAVIPYCYDETLSRPRSVVEHAGPFRHLVFFGRLETRKGLHLFCRALANTPELGEHVERVTFLGKPSTVEGLPSEEFIASHMATMPSVQWEVLGTLGSFEAQAWLASQEHALVVAPSIVDNLPYAVIELQTRRIPFISTSIGGIPEIVGAANAHVLAAPTDTSLASTMLRVCRDGVLVVDYRSGYDVSAANQAHVDFVRRMLAEPAPVAPPSRTSDPFDVVVTNVEDDDALARVRARAVNVDRSMKDARWMRLDSWRSCKDRAPALFLDAGVEIGSHLSERLLRAMHCPGVDAATSYFTRGDDRGPTSHIVTPLGGSLEAGWRQNVFGGPCLAAHPSAFPLVESSIVNGRFAFWPAYAAIACAGLSLAVVPAPLYAVAAEVGDDDRHADIEAVLQRYHSWTPAGLDLGWVLKSAFSGQAVSPDDGVDGPAGRALYDRLVALPDQLIRAYAGLDEESSPDSLLRDFATVRQRVSAVLARWHETEPRVFVYGAGVHSKMLFAVCPDLGRLVAGFIDRRPMQRFLGKPCVTPEGFGPEMADAIVYSSREHECEMHARMKSAPVEHVLLYHESPPAPEASTTRRLRNRFGHQGADLDALASMYVVPTWATGFVSGSDAAFLVEMIAAQQPRTVVELGVASGASSAAILHGLDRLPDIDGGRVLHSCDVRSTCYFDEAYETGQACREMYPSPRATWRREFAMDAPRLVTTLPEASVDLTFIDANHSHPWPLLDLLHLSAVARPGSWVVLHDIDLPLHHPEYQVYGPRWLFRAWRHNKVKGLGPWTSIGALQLPARRSELVPMALALLKRPWEQAPSLQAIELPSAFAEIQAALEARLGTAQPSLV